MNKNFEVEVMATPFDVGQPSDLEAKVLCFPRNYDASLHH